jgi:hypothetical protein
MGPPGMSSRTAAISANTASSSSDGGQERI